MLLMGLGLKLYQATFLGRHLSEKLHRFEFFVRFFDQKTLQAETQHPDALCSLPAASPATQHHFGMSLTRQGKKIEVSDPENTSQPPFFC